VITGYKRKRGEKTLREARKAANRSPAATRLDMLNGRMACVPTASRIRVSSCTSATV
jgi:hypothetical protein